MNQFHGGGLGHLSTSMIVRSQPTFPIAIFAVLEARRVKVYVKSTKECLLDRDAAGAFGFLYQDIKGGRVTNNICQLEENRRFCSTRSASISARVIIVSIEDGPEMKKSRNGSECNPSHRAIDLFRGRQWADCSSQHSTSQPQHPPPVGSPVNSGMRAGNRHNEPEPAGNSTNLRFVCYAPGSNHWSIFGRSVFDSLSHHFLVVPRPVSRILFDPISCMPLYI